MLGAMFAADDATPVVRSPLQPISHRSEDACRRGMFGRAPMALRQAAAPADEFALNYRPDKHLFHLTSPSSVFRERNIATRNRLSFSRKSRHIFR
jgi:hypothetical protein